MTKAKKKPLTRRLDGVVAASKPSVPMIEHPTVMKVRTKFVVVDKQEVPEVVGHELLTKYHVKLAAAYEAKPIHNGLATEQGNIDNKMFGLGQPEAGIVLVIHSKAIADTFGTGRAFHVDFTEL